MLEPHTENPAWLEAGFFFAREPGSLAGTYQTHPTYDGRSRVRAHARTERLTGASREKTKSPEFQFHSARARRSLRNREAPPGSIPGASIYGREWLTCRLPSG